MAKALKTVALVVGAVALVATGVGAALGGLAAGAAAAGGTAAIGASLVTIGTIASVAAGILSLGASLLAPKPSFSSSGNPQQFSTNPQSGLPYCIGRTAQSGVKAHGATSRSYTTAEFDDIISYVVLLSAGGQIDAIEQFTADTEPVTFDGDGQAIGGFYLWMTQRVSLGQPGAGNQQVELHYSPVPGWTEDHELSGMSFATWQLKYDKDGGYYSAGVPNPRWVGRWVRVYDPRLDSTYPGGSGPCRALDESTYVWSRNGALHALTWAMGRLQNGKRTLGIGAPLSMIRVGDFVEAANVADANEWGCGGVVYSTDSKWTVLKSMLQACGAVPTMTAAMIGCRVNMPRVSVATITSADLLDGLSNCTTKSRRDRINTIRPRYRSEANDWEVVTGSVVTVPAWVALDGGERAKELDLPLVQAEVDQDYDGERQAGELAMYEIVNAREAGPISFATGPKFIGLRNGDCITLDVPEEGLPLAKMLLTSDPVFDPASGKFRFTCETETDSKHDFALGRTSTPPTPFTPSAPAMVPPVPLAGDWTLTAGRGADGGPVLIVQGTATDPIWRSVRVSYRKVGAAGWSSWGSIRDTAAQRAEITGLDGLSPYEVQIAYASDYSRGPWLNLGTRTTPENLLVGAPDGTPLGRYDVTQVLDYIRSVPVDFANHIGRIAGVAEKADSLVKTVRSGQGKVLNDNAGFDIWEPGQPLPEGHDEWRADAGTTRNRVLGIEGNWAIEEITTDDTQLIGSEQTIQNVTPGWIELRATVELAEGALDGAVLNLNAFDVNGAFIADAFAPASASNDYEGGSAIALVQDKDASNTVVGSGTEGKVYRFRKLLHLTSTDVATLKLQRQTNSEFYGPNTAKRLIWHRAEAAIPDRAGVLTKINQATLIQQAAVLAGTNDMEVIWRLDGSVSSGDSGADFFIRANARASVDDPPSSSVAIGAQAIWILNPDVEGDYRKVFGVEDGVVYVLTKLVADTIEAKNFINNATVAPARAISSTSVAGDSSMAFPTYDWRDLPLNYVMSATVEMTEPGWIEVICVYKQDFSAGDKLWAADLSVGVDRLEGSHTGGGATQDSVTVGGAYYADTAGFYEVSFNQNSHTSITRRDAVMFVKGYQKTE